MKKFVMPAVVLMGGLMLAACSPAPSAPAEAPAPAAEPMPEPMAEPAAEPMVDPAAEAPMVEGEGDMMENDDAPHSSGERVTPAAPTDAATEDDDAPHSSGERV